MPFRPVRTIGGGVGRGREVDGKAVEALASQVRNLIRDIPNFPKPGVLFKDLMPVFADGPTHRALIDGLASRYAARQVDAVVGIESRGFLLAAPLAYALGCGTVVARKPGKLPGETRRVSYALEYGEDELHMHLDALREGAQVVVVDDLLATGGTMRATCDLVEHSKAHVLESVTVVELSFLNGRDRLGPYDFFSLVQYLD